MVSSQRATDQWQVLPPVAGDVPFSLTHLRVNPESPSGVFSYADSDQPFDKVISEIGSAVANDEARSQLSFFFVSGSLNAPESSAASRIYSHVSESTNLGARALGLHALIKSGDLAALIRLSKDPDLIAYLESRSLLSSVVCDVRTTEPSGIAALDALLKASKSDGLQRCAAHAMRAIHTRETLPVLAALLESGVSDLRYEGVAGLAAYAMKLPVQKESEYSNLGFLTSTTTRPSPSASTTEEEQLNFPTLPAFLEDETRYVEFWKLWWSKHRSDLGF